KPDEISVIVGLGMHRKMSEEEMRQKFGAAIDRVEVVNHDPLDEQQLVYLGRTRSGGPVYVNRLVAEADLVIAVGVVEPHQYAGFSGGRKLVAVGAAGVKTIAHTHQPRFIDAAGTRPGVLRGNPFHHELVEIARMTNLRFAVNVVLNAEQELVRCFAGEPNISLEAAARLARKLYIRPVKGQADILVLGVGHPKDRDLYQASRGVTYAYFASKPAVREGGVIVLAAPCPEGVGDQRFEAMFACAETPSELVAKGKRLGFEPGEQRAYMLARVLERVQVVVAGSVLPSSVLRRMFLGSSPSIQEALVGAFNTLGRDAKVLVIPHSLLTIPSVKIRSRAKKKIKQKK
ncbi:MAG: nickel-dependent lactate racemase, partial [Hadesarchaea archaeon]|nr:nickel-dependent lactate racemase [Hadesarchaea archaeon]